MKCWYISTYRYSVLISKENNPSTDTRCPTSICHTSFVDILASFSSSVGPVANAMDVLQPSRLIVLTLSPPLPVCLDAPTFAARYLHVHNSTRDPSSKRWNCVGENWPVILPEIVTSTSIQGSFTCRKSATRDPQLYFPSEGRCAEDFIALKNPNGFSRV